MSSPQMLVPMPDPRAARIEELQAESTRLQLLREPKTGDALFPFTDPAGMKLTPRQRHFVHEYLVDLCAAKAAARAGYKNPAVRAFGLMQESHVRAHIERAIETRLARIGLRQDAVVDELAVLATSSLDHYTMNEHGDVVPAPGAPYGCMRAVQSVKRKVHEKIVQGQVVGRTYEVDIKLWDKPSSLRLLGMHLGMKFTDRVEVTGKDGGPLVTKVIREIVDPAEGAIA